MPIYLVRIISVLGFLLLWEILASLTAITNVLPTPIDVFLAFKELLFSTGPVGVEWAGELLGHSLISLARVLIGFSIAAFLGVFLGIVMGWWRTARYLIEPVTEVLRPIPPLAWIPLAMLWFGLGFKPAVFLICLGAFFPILVNTTFGIDSTSKMLVDVAKTLGAKQRHLLCKVAIPSATPSIMSGLKIGLGVGWMCLVAAELTGTNSGLGFMIMYYYSTMEPAKTMTGMIMIGLIGILIAFGLRKYEKRLLLWQEKD